MIVCPCTPDKTGVGWEQRAYAFVLAYSQYFDINLWFIPSSDNPNIERVEKLKPLCVAIIPFSNQSLIKNSKLINKFKNDLKSSNCVHLFRSTGLVNIKHECIFWDIDELPVELRDVRRNKGLGPIPTESIQKMFSMYRHFWKQARRVFSCSYLEENKALGTAYYMPNVYSTDHIGIERRPPNQILFVGNTNFYPNFEAIVYFHKKILPLLPKSICFTVVGRSPKNSQLNLALMNLMKDKQIKFFFDVDICTPYYERSSIAVAPLSFGGGTKLKVLEAFAHGRPVISTSKGCEGFGVKDGKEVFICDSPNEFARACEYVMNNSLIGDSLAQNAYRYLIDNHSQVVFDQRLALCLREEGLI